MRIDDEHRFSLSFRGLSIMTAEIRDAFSDILSVMFAQNMWAHINHPLELRVRGLLIELISLLRRSI